MAPNDSTTFLRVILALSGIAGLVYGLGFLLIPGTLVAMSGGSPVDFGWLRWPGGWLLGLVIGNALVISTPAKQRPYVTMLATGNLLAGLALLYSWIAQEYSGATWFIVTPIVISLVISALLWWARYQASEIQEGESFCPIWADLGYPGPLLRWAPERLSASTPHYLSFTVTPALAEGPYS